jgi:hypothetical protein
VPHETHRSDEGYQMRDLSQPAPPSREAEIAARLAKPFSPEVSVVDLARDATYLLAQLQQAREALTKYGKHQFQCAYMEQGDCDCTCGLDAALKAGR